MTGTALAPLAFEGQAVRIIDRDGDPWFVATDAAKVLGYDHTPNLVRLLDDDEKGVHIVSTLGGEQNLSVISEAGLYRAIVQRRASDAVPVEKRAAIERFQRWVFHDVLPSIRRTGSYASPAVEPPKVSRPKEVASAFRSFASIGRMIGLDKNQAALAANRATFKTTGVNALALMETTHLDAPENERLLTPTEIGREIEPAMSAQRVNLWLADHGYQHSVSTGWEPTPKGKDFGRFQDTGKKQGDGTPIRQLKWRAGILDEMRNADGPSP